MNNQTILNPYPGHNQPVYVSLAYLKQQLKSAKLALLRAKGKDDIRFARQHIDAINGQIGLFGNKGKHPRK